jgi:D-alanyl-D-alanine dipeptidase
VSAASAQRAGSPATVAPAPGALARQLVVVTTPEWDAVTGVMRRYARSSAGSRWRAEGGPVPVVVGRAGLAWGDDALRTSAREPRKREGDGRAPAGMFPLDTAFGFEPALPWVRLPYLPLTAGSECVDDSVSVHYNTIVDRDAVPIVDWTSAEHMRRIEQYRLGVVVGYNARLPRRGLGSCIFLHVWAGPQSPTAGCTAMPAAEMASLLRWLDPPRRPVLVQLPATQYATLRRRWRLP